MTLTTFVFRGGGGHTNVKVMQQDQIDTRSKSCQKNPREAKVNQAHSTKSMSHRVEVPSVHYISVLLDS